MLALAKTVDGWKAHLLGAAIMVVGVCETGVLWVGDEAIHKIAYEAACQ